MLRHYFEGQKNNANCLNGQPKDSHNAICGLVLPSHCTASCLGKGKEMVGVPTVHSIKPFLKGLILPSFELSQKQVLAVCNPAPFFCMMIQFTGKTYNSI